MPQIRMKELLEAGVHFGHLTQHWNPKMKPYLYGERNKIHIVDLQKTAENLKKACQFLVSTVGNGKKVLFVGTKKQARSVVEKIAQQTEMFYVSNRWLGGTLTNYETIRMSVEKLKKLEVLKASSEWKDVSKKHQSRLERQLFKLKKSLEGLKEMKKLPGAMVVFDSNKERIAIAEANKLDIPIVAVVDTNSDPRGVDFVIPGNDDAIKSIQLFARIFQEACIEGKKLFEATLQAQGKEIKKEAKQAEKPIEKEASTRVKESLKTKNAEEKNKVEKIEKKTTKKEEVKAQESKAGKEKTVSSEQKPTLSEEVKTQE